MPMSVSDVASELRAMASRVRCLPPPNHRRPDAFHEARSELARELDAIADRVGKGCTAKAGAEAPQARREFHRPPDAAPPRQSSGREVMVEIRRRRLAVRKEVTESAQNAVFAARPGKSSL